MKVVAELRRRYRLSVLLKVSGVRRSTFYYTLGKADKDGKNEEIFRQIEEIYHRNKGRYGYRRILLELANRGYKVNHKKVKRIMSKLGIRGITPKGKYNSYKGDQNGTCKNLLLNKVVDGKSTKRDTRGISRPPRATRNGRRTSPSST